MVFTSIWCLLACCALSVATVAGEETTTDKTKVIPQNISALYIGDLLRTKPLQDLEEAGSAQQPLRAHHSYLSRHRPHNAEHDAYEGHENLEPVQQGRSFIPVDAHTSKPVVGRTLHLRPVHLAPTAPRSHREELYHENDDESRPYERRPYLSGAREYRREKQVAPPRGYKDSQESYEEEDDRSDGYSSHSEPTRGSYESKTHPSKTNSASKSSNSYSQSKSTSTSKTLTPKRVRQTFSIVPKKFAESEVATDSPHANEDQAKDHPKQGRRGYPQEHAEHGSTDKTPYTQYPPVSRDHQRGSDRSKNGYSNSAREENKPQSYPIYESEYDQNTRSPKFNPTESYQPGRDYSPHSKEPEPHHKQIEHDHRYGVSNKRRPSANKPYFAHGESHDDREGASHRHIPTAPSYNHSGARYQENLNQPGLYEDDTSRETTPGYVGPPSYHGNLQGLRPYEDRSNPMDITHQVGNRNPLDRSHKKQFYESPRYARSSGLYLKPTESEEHRALSNERPVAMLGKESKPYVSRSVSYSNGDDSQLPRAQADEQMLPLHAERPVAYKPYNSEYPASYANDPIHKPSKRQPESRNYHGRQSQEQPDSYEDGSSRYREDPYDEGGSYEQGAEDPKQGGKGNHHYVSNVEGYRDEYHSDVPLHLDDAFFKKYGISKKAKIIVASAVQPHLHVADGSDVPEGGYQGDEETGPSGGYSGSEEDHNPSSYEQDSQQNEAPEDPENFQVPENFQAPENFQVPRELPGSFDELVNPKFILPTIMTPIDSAFKNEDTFDEVDFHNVAHKGFVVSQGPREIVQQHGDGVSRILFNVPRKDDGFKRSDDEALLSAATALLEDIIKSDS